MQKDVGLDVLYCNIEFSEKVRSIEAFKDTIKAIVKISEQSRIFKTQFSYAVKVGILSEICKNHNSRKKLKITFFKLYIVFSILVCS